MKPSIEKLKEAGLPAPVREDLAQLEPEMSRLEEENAALKQKVLDLETDLSNARIEIDKLKGASGPGGNWGSAPKVEF